jgi:hypothetical protein
MIERLEAGGGALLRRGGRTDEHRQLLRCRPGVPGLGRREGVYRRRRMIEGQYHRVVEQHLGAYPIHAGWLEDHRDQSNGALVDPLISGALAAPVSQG